MMENQKNSSGVAFIGLPLVGTARSRRIRHNIGCWVGPNQTIKWGQAGAGEIKRGSRLGNLHQKGTIKAGSTLA